MSLLSATKKFLQSFVENKEEKDKLLAEQLVGMSHSEKMEVFPSYKKNFLDNYKAKEDIEKPPKNPRPKRCPRCTRKKGYVVRGGIEVTCPLCGGTGIEELTTL